MADPRPPVRYEVDVSNLAVLDPLLAHLCAWCSYYAYFDNAAQWFSEILNAGPIYRIPADEATGRPQGYRLNLQEVCIVVFAGTTDYSQLYGTLRDTLYYRVPGLGATIVAGKPWAKAVKDVRTSYYDLLADTVTFKKTVFTGHSLGGAIAATLCASLQGSGIVGALPSTAVTFGCPRLGNDNLAVATAGFHNVVISGDVVAKLPPRGFVRPLLTSSDADERAVWPTDGFKRHGRVTYLNGDGGLSPMEPGVTLNPEDAGVEWDAASAFGEAFLSGVQWKNPVRLTAETFRRGLEAHYMEEYLRRLERNVPAEPEADGVGMKKYGEVIANAMLADPPQLATISPPAYPTGVATTGVRPLRKRHKH